MRWSMSVRREHLAELMIPDVTTATGTNSKSATSLEYLHLIQSSAALDTEPGFKMVVYWLLAEKESVLLASQANALPHLKGIDVILSGLLRLPR